MTTASGQDWEVSKVIAYILSHIMADVEGMTKCYREVQVADFICTLKNKRKKNVRPVCVRVCVCEGGVFCSLYSLLTKDRRKMAGTQGQMQEMKRCKPDK